MIDEYSLQPNKSARIVFRDGKTFFGTGYGSEGIRAAEICFNTSMTGYQEILTDPSYYKQILTFTFPHIGNVGTNLEDYESIKPFISGIVTNSLPTEDSNWRSLNTLDHWLKRNNVIGVCNLDTREITNIIRDTGVQDVVIEYKKDCKFADYLVKKKLSDFPGLKGMDLAKSVSCKKPYKFKDASFYWVPKRGDLKKTIVALDYGIKLSILRQLASYGFEIFVVPADSSFEEIMRFEPDGVFLSNGPGDPAATFKYTGITIKALIAQTKLPIFGICLGHQLLALALGAKTKKMHHGHHGANHPVKHLASNRVLVTSMNHGFTIDQSSLPSDIIETYVSLFDGSNCGIELTARPIYSVQFHPEASPGPMDANILFDKFAKNVVNEIV